MNNLLIGIYRDEDAAEIEKMRLSQTGKFKSLSVSQLDSMNINDCRGDSVHPTMFTNVWVLVGQR